MLKSISIKAILILSLSLFSVAIFANASHEELPSKKEEKYNPVPVIMEHIMDAHGWHLWGAGHDAVSIPLPIILWADNGLVLFMSNAFHHDTKGEYVVTRKGMQFVNFHEKIYQLDAGVGHLKFDKEGSVTSVRPIDLSVTKNVASMLVSVMILFLVFFIAAASYKGEIKAPKGIAGFMEPIILFVKNDIAIPNIGKEKHGKFMPFLLTAFFFIWFNNLLGLIPFIPGGANLTGNIAVTMVLATFTLLLTNLNGNKNYWSHILWMPGVPAVIKMFILTPLEIIGILTKPFALMIRLFANITAGHVIVLSLISLIFIFKSAYMGFVAVPFTLFISVLELLVALLQAYIFTMLSALFIGSAVADPH